MGDGAIWDRWGRATGNDLLLLVLFTWWQELERPGLATGDPDLVSQSLTLQCRPLDSCMWMVCSLQFFFRHHLATTRACLVQKTNNQIKRHTYTVDATFRSATGFTRGKPLWGHVSRQPSHARLPYHSTQLLSPTIL